MITAYLTLTGNAKEAAAYYAQAFGGQVAYMMTGDQLSKEDRTDFPEGYENLVIYANVKTFCGDIMMSDAMPNEQITKGDNVWLNVSSSDLAKLHSVFDALGKDGQVIMPLSTTFFSPLYGQLVDKYGFYWMFMSDEGF